MLFRNITFFQFPITLDVPRLDECLDQARLKPIGPLELSSRGFISPFGRDGEVLSHRIGDAIWLTVGGEDRMLPAAVVNEQLAKRVAELEEKEGRKLGGKARNRIKHELLHELIPRAFVKASRMDAMLDMRHGFIAIDTSSRRVAETVVSEIRRALGSFPALPLNPESFVRGTLTSWVQDEVLPDGFLLDEECILKDPYDRGAIIKCQHQDLGSREIQQHLKAGKQVTRLALNFDSLLSFVLGEDLIVRKLKFLEGTMYQLESMEREDLRAELDARFALLSGEVRRLFLLFKDVFKLSEAA